MATTIKGIEEEIDEIQMLMKIWNKFYNILNTTFYNPEPATIKKLDPEFQQIKQVIAEHHAYFMKVIRKDFHIGQSVLTTVKRTISLDGFQNLSPLEINKTLIEWHEANILLNETLGSLECERDFILRGRQKAKLDSSKDKGKKSAKKSGAVKMVINLVIVAAIVGALVMYWDTISQSQYYKDYLKWMVDPILKMVGVSTGE